MVKKIASRRNKQKPSSRKPLPEKKRKEASVHLEVHAGSLYLLHQAYLSYRDLLEDATRQYHQTPGAAIVLSLIARNPGVTAAQLSKWLHVASQSVNVHVAGLIDKGFVARKIDRSNQRALNLCITPKGRQALRRSRAAFDKAEAEISKLVNEETRTRLRPILMDLIEGLRAHQERQSQI